MQFVAVILLCALGTWVFSGLDAAWRMIDLSGSTYFDQQQLADLWVTLPSVDRETLQKAQRVNDVETVQARSAAEFRVDLPHEPSLRTVGLDGEPTVNLPLMYEGEMLAESDRRGCLLDREFARANGFAVGDRLTVVEIAEI